MFGHLSDSKLGRRGALLVSSCTIAAFGMLTAASPNYVVYVALRALTGAASSGLGVVAYVLGIELIGPSCRGTVSLSSFYFYPVGTLLLAGVAFLCTATMSLHYSWRFLYLFTSLPSLVYCFLIVVFIHESPRWYLVHDYNQKAMQVLRSIGNQNGREIPRDIVLVTDERELDEAGDSENAPQTTGTLVDVFRRRDTRFRLIVVVIVWFACALGYYTFNLNVGNLGTNLTLSVVLNGLSEIPGYAVATFLSHRVGRRISLAVTLILGGIASLIGAVLSLHVDNFISAHFHALQIFGAADDNPSATLFLPSSSHMPSVNQAEKHISASVGQNRLESANAGSYIYLVCSMVGLFGMSGAYNILFLYGSELFPTVVRNAALAFANQGGTLGSIVAPFVVTSAHQNTAIPFLVIAFTSLLAGISALKLPETMNRPLHETFDHV
ncbi:hypothetical protein KP509_12G085500 [Ceratopteris richardii]|nr:hypothetical protein KP509_12G085500 [Ceratopteris richardii]